MSDIVVVDYGSGNVESVLNAMSRVAHSVRRSGEAAELLGASAIVIPGVGAFPAFMSALASRGLVDPVRARVADGVPVLGICVGMQAMGKFGLEHEVTPGLGVVDGTVTSLRSMGISDRVPHVGWNGIRLSEEAQTDSPLRILAGRDVYFMHSFAFPANTHGAIGWTEYNVEFCSAIQSGSAMGIQFHPEKSQQAGLDFLEAWVHFARDR